MPDAASWCWKSNPPRPGSLTSSTRQPGASGRLLCTNSGAHPNESTSNPTERNSLARASRTDGSSSTTKTTGCSSLINIHPRTRWRTATLPRRSAWPGAAQRSVCIHRTAARRASKPMRSNPFYRVPRRGGRGPQIRSPESVPRHWLDSADGAAQLQDGIPPVFSRGVRYGGDPPRMQHKRSHPRPESLPVLPVIAAALAVAIFVVDAFTPLDIAVAVLYVVAVGRAPIASRTTMSRSGGIPDSLATSRNDRGLSGAISE